MNLNVDSSSPNPVRSDRSIRSPSLDSKSLIRSRVPDVESVAATNANRSAPGLAPQRVRAPAAYQSIVAAAAAQLVVPAVAGDPVPAVAAA